MTRSFVDYQVFLQSNSHARFTPRAVARIMHGIASPAYPYTIWGKTHFWYDEFYFYSMFLNTWWYKMNCVAFMQYQYVNLTPVISLSKPLSGFLFKVLVLVCNKRGNSSEQFPFFHFSTPIFAEGSMFIRRWLSTYFISFISC